MYSIRESKERGQAKAAKSASKETLQAEIPVDDKGKPPFSKMRLFRSASQRVRRSELDSPRRRGKRLRLRALQPLNHPLKLRRQLFWPRADGHGGSFVGVCRRLDREQRRVVRVSDAGDL